MSSKSVILYARYEGKHCDMYCDFLIKDLKFYGVDILHDPICFKFSLILDSEYDEEIDGAKLLRCDECVREYFISIICGC